MGVLDQFSLIPSKHSPNAVEGALTIEFCQFLEQANGVAQPEQLFDTLSAFALNFNCPWTAYRHVPSDQKLLKPVIRYPAVMLNYPDEWEERYFELGYDKIDPIIKMSRRRADAFQWSEVYNDTTTTEDERRVIDEAASFGLRSGVSVPLHSPDSSFAIISFARSLEQEFNNQTLVYLQFAAFHFHVTIEKLVNISRQEIPKLSVREKECIMWAAMGKTSWEAGKILGISASTVNFHIKNVKQKLDAPSRTLASIKAIRYGIIKI